MSAAKTSSDEPHAGWKKPRPYRGYPWIELTFLLVIATVAWAVWAMWGGR